MNLEVESLSIYPLTGGPAVSVRSGDLSRGGLRFDREYLIYDSERKRVGSKQAPELFGLDVKASIINCHNHVYLNAGDDLLELTSEVKYDRSPTFEVDEFGDGTVCHDAGDSAASFFQEVTGRQDVRLAKKSAEWLAGRSTPKPVDRAVAPLHIVTRATVDWAQSMPGGENVDGSRFRPNMVIAGDLEPEAELDWVGKTLIVGKRAIAITRATQRCVVPGFDPASGDNLKDAPKLYPNFQKREHNGYNKAVFGVYGVPIKTGYVAVGNLVIVE